MKPRLENIHPEDLTPEQREIYDKFASGRRAAANTTFSLVGPKGELIGPPNGWLLRPPLGNVLERFGNAMRYEISMAPKSREMAILMVGHFRQSPFELYAHTQAGRAVGLSEADLEALARGEEPEFEDDTQRAIYRATRRLLESGTLETDEYWEIVDVLGIETLFELVIMVGYYQMLATQLSVFDVQPPLPAE